MLVKRKMIELKRWAGPQLMQRFLCVQGFRIHFCFGTQHFSSFLRIRENCTKPSTSKCATAKFSRMKKNWEGSIWLESYCKNFLHRNWIKIKILSRSTFKSFCCSRLFVENEETFRSQIQLNTESKVSWKVISVIKLSWLLLNQLKTENYFSAEIKT